MASPDRIRSAISACSSASVRRDASATLLDAARRREYDQLNSLLFDIGDLRAGLGLNHADNWDGNLANEYPGKSRGASEYEQLIARGRASEQAESKSGGGFGFFVLSAFVLVGFWLFYDNSSSNKATAEHSVVASAPTPRKETTAERPVVVSAPAPVPELVRRTPPKPVFNAPPVSAPRNGAVRWYISLPGEAPLKIRTSSGSDYFVKLENSQGKNIMDIFVKGGRTVEVDVPIGRYILKYASGATWYGYKHHFGPKTDYNKADTVLSFEKEYINDGYREGYRVSGHVITLYRVSGGNLTTSEIPKEAF